MRQYAQGRRLEEAGRRPVVVRRPLVMENRRQSLFEARQFAVAHWSSRAENARLSACFLWQFRERAEIAEAVSACDYKGSPQIALSAAWSRESAVAMELIVKAVIAQRRRVLIHRASPCR
jgi:hypothetical protein